MLWTWPKKLLDRPPTELSNVKRRLMFRSPKFRRKSWHFLIKRVLVLLKLEYLPKIILN